MKDPDNTEAGAWQASADAMRVALQRKAQVLACIPATDGDVFKAPMKQDHVLAMEDSARLLHLMVAANVWLCPMKLALVSRVSVQEF